MASQKSMWKIIIDSIFSIFIQSYWKNTIQLYSSIQENIQLNSCAYKTDRKKHLDNKKIVGVVLMDLSKVFDCVPHDLLIAKLHAHGFTKKALTFLYLYLKRRKQSVKKMIKKVSFKSFYQEYPKDLFLDLFSLIFL